VHLSSLNVLVSALQPSQTRQHPYPTLYELPHMAISLELSYYVAETSMLTPNIPPITHPCMRQWCLFGRRARQLYVHMPCNLKLCVM
jgi:hypothetical protein